MNWTNRYNLPKAFVNAVTNDPYSKGDSDFSVTELLSPPRARVLTKRHFKEIKKDVSENLWVVFGRAVHKILEENACTETTIPERRLSITLPHPFNKELSIIVSGGMDSYLVDGKTLQDYKTTSVFAVKDGGRREWEEQLNCYAAILRSHSIEIEKLEAVPFIKDFRASEKKWAFIKNENYPESPIVKLPIELWPENLAIEFMKERVRLHLEAETELPVCTDEEVWLKPTTYAVKKRGQKYAIKGGLFTTFLDAQALVDKDPGLVVEKRPGQRNKCNGYCDAAAFCEEYQSWKKTHSIA